MAKITWIGLGQMGHPMALNLRAAGHHVRGVEGHAAAIEKATAAGFEIYDDAATAVAEADFVFTMLPNGDVVEKVLLSAGGVFDSVPAGAVVIDCSTIDVTQTRNLHEAAAEAGVRFLDAPVSGGVSGAAAGTLTIMVGGAANTLHAAKSVLETIGQSVIHVGGAGTGQTAKLINNMILGINLAATCEGVALAERLGLDPAVLFDVVSRSSGDNWALRTWYPAAGVVDSAAVNRGFAPGFTTSLLVKDLGLALRAGACAGISLETATLVHRLFSDHAAADGAHLDCSSLITTMRGTYAASAEATILPDNQKAAV
jgi:3-hydroxyisobutyrate dehydrogenase